MKSKEVAECLHSDDCAVDGVVLMDRLLLVPFRVEKDLQGFPGTTA